MARGDDHNLLVISDLHLGEELRAEVHDAASFAELSLGLTSFLLHFAANPVGGRPWLLAINGDMVDFLSVHLMPHQVRRVTGLPEEDHTWGLGTHPIAAVHKLRTVIAHHEQVFDALTRFVLAGNSVSIAVGNHDREFFWEEVQVALRQEIERRGAALDPAAVLGGRVTFYTWFLYLPGLIWLEHGDQHDAYCSVDLVLDPRDGHDAFALEYNVGEAAMRYIANRLPDSPESQQNQGFIRYIRLPFQRTERAAMLFAGYGQLNLRMLAQWFDRMTRPAVYAERRARHATLLDELAASQELNEQAVRFLDAARTPPLYASLDALVTSLMLGRFLLLLGGLFMVPATLIGLTWPLAPTVAGASTLVAAALAALLTARRPDPDPQDDMLAAAERIHGIVGVPFVVMGHSHAPVAKRLAHGGWYFNTGTWVGGRRAPRNFTHLVLTRRDDGQHAALCQWRDGQSWELRAERSAPPFRPPWSDKVPKIAL